MPFGIQASGILVPPTGVYVDVNRSDSYIENGSIIAPFKTLAAAIAAFPGGGIQINIAPGSIAGNFTFPANTSVLGAGIGITVFTGNLTTAGTGVFSVHGLTCQGKILCSCEANIGLCVIGELEIADGGRCANITVSRASGAAMTVSGSPAARGTMLVNCVMQSGDSQALVHTGAKRLTLNSCQLTGNHATLAAFSSSGAGSIIMASGSLVVNQGGGPSIDCQNGAQSTDPNVIGECTLSGNVVAGTAYTAWGPNVLGGTLTGSALLLQSSSLQKNDSSVSGTTVTDALNTLGAGGGGASDDIDIPVATGQSVSQGDVVSLYGNGVRKAEIGYRMTGAGKFPEPLNFASLFGASTNGKPIGRIGSDRVLYISEVRNYFAHIYVVSFNEDGTIASVGNPMVLASQYVDNFDVVAADDGKSPTGNWTIAVLSYSAGGGSIRSVAVNIRGTEIIGLTSELVVQASGTATAIASCRLTQTQILLTYTRSSDTQRCYCVPITVSTGSSGATGLVLGTEATYQEGASTHFCNAIAALTSTKAVVCFSYGSGMNAIIVSVSGTTASFPGVSTQIFSAIQINAYNRVDALSSSSFICFSCQSNKGMAVPCTESSSVIAVGTQATSVADLGNSTGIAMSASEFVLFGVTGKALRGKISGTTATINEHDVYNFKALVEGQGGGSNFSYIWGQKIGEDKVLLVCEPSVGDSNPIFITLFREWTTRQDYVGIATEAKASGETCRVQYRGVVTTSGLTAGTLYYNNSGSLTTSVRGEPVGRALSTTQLQLF